MSAVVLHSAHSSLVITLSHRVMWIVGVIPNQFHSTASLKFIPFESHYFISVAFYLPTIYLVASSEVHCTNGPHSPTWFGSHLFDLSFAAVVGEFTFLKESKNSDSVFARILSALRASE
ncbi:hypothetical protein DSO57_1034175 [Entomophthora muscae]|uniref:Uncharacterized protein n=1 Tax=Entomophthora muscae TaxID=34485 RepID=A0ACC2SCZ7_9FUNG|nr:hypothetical protein DSO57_1034175 [Entomophthora muscae]